MQAGRGERSVVVCGAGPVGAAFALLACEMSGDRIRPTLIDARTLAESTADDRLIAISEGSRVLLERVGAWSDELGVPIHRIHVSRRGAFGRCLIDRDDYGVGALGWVVNYGATVARLAQCLTVRGLEVVRPARATIDGQSADRPSVTLDDGQSWLADYVVHAEGATFAAEDQDARRRDYGQSAVTAFVSCTLPAKNVAWERFTDQGPLALLPARRGEREGLCLVWCQATDAAQRRLELTEAAFLHELHETFGDRLGRFSGLEGRRVFPLALQAVDEIVRGREFAIGNAAQTLHPVAGQGLNLGLRDAHTLAARLTRNYDSPEALATEYRRARRVDRGATVQLTDLLARIFAPRAAPLALMRSMALTLLDLAPAARHVLARHMMDGQR